MGGTGGGHIPLHLIVLRCDNLLQGILKYNKNIIFNFFFLDALKCKEGMCLNGGTCIEKARALPVCR